MLGGMTRIVCQQLAPRIGDLTTNHALSVRAIGEAVDLGADVVVLPELVTSGYVFASFEEAAAMAVTPEHQLFADWAREAARGPSLVVGGFCERGADGLLYNSAAVVDAAGVRAVYRKTHLWDREKLVFTPGTDPPPVVETPAGRIGVLLCYDLEFPELTRALALRGADLIAAPVNWPLVERPTGERPPEVIIAMAAARTNRVAVACCDRSGVERGQAWTGGTALIDTSGWVVSVAGAGTTTEEAVTGRAVADVDLSCARDKRLSDRNDAFGDRRPGLYSSVTATDPSPAAHGASRGSATATSL